MRESFKFSRILSVLAVMVALMTLPSIGHTMSYDQGFVDGQSQVSELQTQISTLSTHMGEMEADIYRVNDSVITGTGGLETSEELSMAGYPNEDEEISGCMACYEQPEVGWRGIF